MARLLATLLGLLRDERGAAVVEYGLVAAFFALPLIAAIVVIQTQIGTVLATSGTKLTNIAVSPP